MLDTPSFIVLQDSRKLCYQEYGAPDGDTVIYAHGGPSCRLEGEIFHEAAIAKGFRIIATDRPGYGQSDVHPHNSLPDYVDDIEQLTAALEIDMFAHIGWSGGGPPTLAVARHIPERLTCAISLAGMPGIEAPEDRQLLSKADRTAVKLLDKSPFMFRAFFGLMGALEKVVPESYYKSFISASGADDARILSVPANKKIMQRIQAEVFRTGSKGLAWDAEMDYEDFGFRPNEIEFPVHIFQGNEDNFVSYELQKKYAAMMPYAVWHDLPGRGHFFPMEMQMEILSLARAVMI